MSPGCPNGETRPRAIAVTARAERTRGTETSQYPEEEKSTEMPQVAASERGPSPNRGPCGLGVVGPADGSRDGMRSPLERGARDGDSPVAESNERDLAVFLSSAMVPRNVA
jgi:hypothetical protein